MVQALIAPGDWYFLPFRSETAEHDIAQHILALRGEGPGSDVLIGWTLHYAQQALDGRAIFALVHFDDDLTSVLAYGECTATRMRDLPDDPGPTPGSELEAMERDHEAREAVSAMRRMLRSKEYADADLTLFKTAAGAAVRAHDFINGEPNERNESGVIEYVSYLVPRSDIGGAIRFTVSWRDAAAGERILELADARAETLTITAD